MTLIVNGSSMTKAGLRSMGISVILWSICAFCLLVIGGKAATVVIVGYPILAGLGFLGALFQSISPRDTSLGIGIVIENGKRSMKFENYDKAMVIYENRLSTWLFWTSTCVTLSWVALFLSVGINLLAYTVILLFVISEIAKYRIFSCIKKNKTAWGAAMFINEIQNFFNGENKL